MKKMVPIFLMAIVLISACACSERTNENKMKDPAKTTEEILPGKVNEFLNFEKTKTNHIALLLTDDKEIDVLIYRDYFEVMQPVSLETTLISPAMPYGSEDIGISYNSSSNSGWPRLILDPTSSFNHSIFYRFQVNLRWEKNGDNNQIEKRKESLFIDIIPNDQACKVEMVTDKVNVHRIANSKDFRVFYEVKSNVDLGKLDVLIDYGPDSHGIDLKKSVEMDLDDLEWTKLYVDLRMLEDNLKKLISETCTLTVMANGHVLAVDTLRFEINNRPWNVYFEKTKTSQIILEYPVDETDVFLVFENQSVDTDLEIYELYLDIMPESISSIAFDLGKTNFHNEHLSKIGPGQTLRFKIDLDITLEIGQYDLKVKSNSKMDCTLKLVVADQEVGGLSLTRETLARFDNGSHISSISGNKILLMQTQNIAPEDFLKYSLHDMNGKFLADLDVSEGDRFSQQAGKTDENNSMPNEKEKNSNTYFLYGTNSDEDKISVASDYIHAPLKLDISAFDCYDFVEYPLFLGKKSFYEYKGKRYFFPSVNDPGQIFYCAGVVCVDVATNRQIWQKAFESRCIYAVSEKYVAMSSIWDFDLRIYDASTGKTQFRSIIGGFDDNGMYYISSLSFHGEYLYATLEYRRDLKRNNEKKTTSDDEPFITSRLVRFKLN